MAFWKDFGKWIPRIAGYAVAAIPGVGPLASAASIAIGEKIGQTVGNTQATSEANKAIQEGAKQGIDTYNQAFGPYMNLGSQAANTMAGLMGFTPSQASATGNTMPADAQATQRSFTGPPVGTAAPRVDQVAMADPRGATLEALSRPQTQTSSSYRRIRMQAPDGEVADVEESEVPMFERLGARRVG